MNNKLVILLYLIALALTLIYFLGKLKKREYIFSFFNVRILIFMFTIFIIGPLQYNLDAWGVLNIKSVDRVVELYPFIDKVYIINLIGFITFIISLAYFELRDKDNKINKSIKKISVDLNQCVFDILFYLSITSWYIITLSINKTLPILNNNRLFIESYGMLKPIYLGVNSIISICATLYAIKCINKFNKKDIINALLAVITILATGNRGPLIMLLTTVIIYALYYRMSNKRLVTIIIVGSLLCLGVVGIGLEGLRGSKTSDNIVTSIAYGNTFSDIRDGALVLEKYEENYDGYLMGKNYLADIMSFIPSSMSEFRKTWAYGHFTTNTLFGWSEHYGLRGGWFLEPYLNFGFIGVMLIAMIYAYFMSAIEIFFYNNVIKNKSSSSITDEMLVIELMSIVFGSMLISSGFNSFYAIFAFVSVNLIVSKIIKSKKYKI